MTAAFDGIVVSFQGSRVLVRDDSGEEYQCQMRKSARDLIPGDRVKAEHQTDGAAVVIAREARNSEFFRTDANGKKKMIAANLDCLALVVAPQPEPHLAMIDRYLASAEIAAIPVEIILNKADLEDTPTCKEIDRIYPSLGYQVHRVSTKQHSGADQLRVWAKDRHLAFLGQSGVGKSSLINLLSGSDFAQVGRLSEKRSKGRHTTTASCIYQMPHGGWIMDSPGVRDFENALLSEDDVLRGFPEIYEKSMHCEFRNCRHDSDKGCAVIEALKSGEIEYSRYQSFCQMRSKY